MKTTHDENRARQEELYFFLQKRGNRWTRMEQVTDSIKLYPAFFTGNYHNSRTRRLLTRDIETINSSDHYSKIIISGSRGIKLATSAEFERFARSELQEVFRKLRRVRRIISKGNHDQQTTLEGEIIDAFMPY